MELDQKLAKAWEAGHISVGTLWEYYTQYPYLTRMRDRQVLVSAISDVLTAFTWEAEGFALADGLGDDGRYTGLVLPGAGASFGMINDATLLVRADVALAQVPGSEPVDIAKEGPSDGSTRVAPPKGGEDDAAPVVRNTRFFGVYEIDAERYSRDLNRLSQEILQHLAALEGVDLDVTVEIRASRPEGFPDDKARIIIENARTLHFRQASFQDD